MRKIWWFLAGVGVGGAAGYGLSLVLSKSSGSGSTFAGVPYRYDGNGLPDFANYKP